MKFYKKFLLSILTVCLIAGCSNKKEEQESNSENVSSDMFGEGNFSTGSIGHGYTEVIDNEKKVFKYDGNEIVVPYKVLASDNDGNELKVGFYVFVNGVPQEYSIKSKDSKKSNIEKKYLHEFTLKDNTEEEFEFHLKPTIGKAGDQLCIHIGSVFNPSYKPTKEKAMYGNYHHISCTIPQIIEFQNDTENKQKIYYNEKLTELSEKAKIDLGAGDDGDAMTSSIIKVNSEDEDEVIVNKLTTKNHKLKLNFDMYGGPNTNYILTCFINDEPVKLGNFDNIHIDLKENKMFHFETDLNTEEFSELSTLQLVAIPCDDSYDKDFAQPTYSNPILVVNE